MEHEGVFVQQHDLEHSLQFTEKVSVNQVNSNVLKRDVSSGKKNFYYFYLLDREEQIQILKFVRSSLIDNGQLFFLEEEDKKNMDIPVYKKLELRPTSDKRK